MILGGPLDPKKRSQQQSPKPQACASLWCPVLRWGDKHAAPGRAPAGAYSSPASWSCHSCRHTCDFVTCPRHFVMVTAWQALHLQVLDRNPWMLRQARPGAAAHRTLLQWLLRQPLWGVMRALTGPATASYHRQPAHPLQRNPTYPNMGVTTRPLVAVDPCGPPQQQLPDTDKRAASADDKLSEGDRHASHLQLKISFWAIAQVVRDSRHCCQATGMLGQNFKTPPLPALSGDSLGVPPRNSSRH